MSRSRSKRSARSFSYLTRRDLLRAGALGMGLPGYLSLSKAANATVTPGVKGFGKAR